MASGVSVVVVRPGKIKMDDGMQVALVAPNYKAIRPALGSGGPKLVVATMSGIRVRDLDELIAEIGGDVHRPAP